MSHNTAITAALAILKTIKKLGKEPGEVIITDDQGNRVKVSLDDKGKPVVIPSK
jgi:hypothetical protein